MSTALVSIVMPTYNRAELLRESIESVLAQTHQDWELIIVDDGSTDDTRNLVASFTDPRIHYHEFDHSANYAIVRNRGIRLVKGEFIAFLDSDDLWDKQKLSVAIGFFRSHPESGFILTNVTLFGRTSSQAPDFNDKLDTFLFNDLIEERSIVFYPSTLVFKKEVLISTGLLNETLPKGADHDFILTLASKVKGSFIGERLSFIRKHASNTSLDDEVNIYQDSIEHVHRFFRKGLLSRKRYQKLTAGYYYKLASILHRKRDKRSRSFFLKSIRVRPFYPKAWLRYLQAFLNPFSR